LRIVMERVMRSLDEMFGGTGLDGMRCVEGVF
jgi:hypothetical protein